MIARKNRRNIVENSFDAEKTYLSPADVCRVFPALLRECGTRFAFFSGEARGPGRNLGGQMTATSNWGHSQTSSQKVSHRFLVRETKQARAGRPAGEPKWTKSGPKGELLGAKSALFGGLLGAQKGAQKCPKRAPKSDPKVLQKGPQKCSKRALFGCFLEHF